MTPRGRSTARKSTGGMAKNNPPCIIQHQDQGSEHIPFQIRDQSSEENPEEDSEQSSEGIPDFSVGFIPGQSNQYLINSYKIMSQQLYIAVQKYNDMLGSLNSTALPNMREHITFLIKSIVEIKKLIE